MAPSLESREIAGFWAVSRPLGAIAQLGERLVRNEEVGGSIPPGSTTRLRQGFGGQAKPAMSNHADSVLRHPAFVLFWFARVAGTVGYQMMIVAVGWQLYALTSSPFDLGLIGLIQSS